MNKTSWKNIMLVAGLHGNEKMPVQAFFENGIAFIHGNPKAYEQNVRFTEKDLNASFGAEDASYESVRAANILRQIPENFFIVDFHTTEQESTPFVIVIDREMIGLAEQTGLTHVVVMRHNIKRGHALINYRNGISVEVGTHTSRDSYDTALRVVKNIQEGRKCPVILYEVYDEIRTPGNYENFQVHDSGFIPVLANEPAYEREGLFGLKARRLFGDRMN
jgi:predicted deacylase